MEKIISYISFVVGTYFLLDRRKVMFRYSELKLEAGYRHRGKFQLFFSLFFVLLFYSQEYFRQFPSFLFRTLAFLFLIVDLIVLIKGVRFLKDRTKVVDPFQISISETLKMTFFVMFNMVLFVYVFNG